MLIHKQHFDERGLNASLPCKYDTNLSWIHKNPLVQQLMISCGRTIL